MFLRFVASTLRLQCVRNTGIQCVRNTGMPVLCRNLHSNRRFCSSHGKDKTNGPKVDPTNEKRVTVVLKLPNGTVREESAYVNERVYDLVRRTKRDEDDLVIIGFGICQGHQQCSTCVVILNEKDFSKILPPTDHEEDCLGDVVSSKCDTARLACCVHITEEMEGVVFHIPAYDSEYFRHRLPKDE